VATLTFIQSLIFVLFVGFVWYRYGVLPSISESWYRLPGHWKDLFTFFCWGIGGTMLFQTDGTTPLFFISGSGFGFVGVATMFRSGDKVTKWVHFTGAVAGILFALIGIWVERTDPYPFFIWISSIPIILIFRIKNYLWWNELVAFFAVIFGFLLS